MSVETLWVAGGLYGNPFALRTLVESYSAEPGSKALVFNGDFHWFDIDSEDFRVVNETVLGFDALRGNVETEIAAPGEGAGCGCAYPDWVGDATVEHSNRIIERLRATARSSGIDGLFRRKRSRRAGGMPPRQQRSSERESTSSLPATPACRFCSASRTARCS